MPACQSGGVGWCGHREGGTGPAKMRSPRSSMAEARQIPLTEGGQQALD